MSKEIILKKGEYVRIRGEVTIYSPYKKTNEGWIGGSSWMVKNPLIRLGKCNHKPKKIGYITNIFGKRMRTIGRVVCGDCGYILKLGEEMKYFK